MLFTLIAFAVALGLLITFHELGHYWVARWCDVRILRFSVGFGRVLWCHKDKRGTEWAISAIPLGGYVKMLDDAPDGASPVQAEQAFNNKSVWQRFAIVVAGPAANLILAAVLYAFLAFFGTQTPAPVIAQPPAGTAAAQAGLQEGDRITTINGQAVQSWADVRWKLLDTAADGGRVQIEVQTIQGSHHGRTLVLPPGEIEPDGADPLAEGGLLLATPRPRIVEVHADSAADEAGLLPGDLVVGVGNLDNPSASELVAQIQQHPGQLLQLNVVRDGVPLQLRLMPQVDTDAQGQTSGKIGVLLGADLPMVTVRHGVGGSLVDGVVRTGQTVWFSLKMMGRMLTGSVSMRNISGPVTIADYAGQSARLGLAAYVGFLALISVSIGVLNLLPIPMLDGGHLMYYLIEILRGKPLSEYWTEAGQRIGLALLAALMGLAFFNDFTRLFS